MNKNDLENLRVGPTFVFEEVNYKHSLMVNQTSSIRMKIGNILRIIAEKIDGAHSFGIHISSTPEISHDRKLYCLIEGIKTMRFALNEETKSQSLEDFMEKHNRDLFEK